MPDSEATRRSRLQTTRVRMLCLIAGSYAIDALLLLGFAYAGTIPPWVPLAFATSGWVSCLVFYVLTLKRSVDTLRDPYLTVPQTIVAAAIQLALVVLVPQITFLNLMVLFIIFGFASLSMSSRTVLAAWFLTAVAIAAALHSAAGALVWLPMRTEAERVLVWLCIVAALGRSILLGAYGRSVRDKLRERHQQLKRALADLQERDAELASNRQSLERANQELQHRATHDTLTGLPNRALFSDRLERALAQAAQHREPIAVLVLDLDRFKLINDTLGHRVGDELLREVAARLKESMRTVDTVARAGGDEFLLIVTRIAGREAIAALAERITASVNGPYWIAGTELHTSPSIGISMYPLDGENAETLLAHADEAMYVAKRQGGNVHQFFARGMETFSHHRLQLENDLRSALALGQLELHYQPKIDVTSGAMTSVEALLRWRHPERGLVPPGEFIPLAEESGLILSIGRWVLREACRQARSWRDSGLATVRVAINVSPVQFRQPGFLAMVRTALADHGIAPESLEIEVTESAVMSNAEGSIEILEELSRMGVIVAIDDFGTGYSSMSYLRRFPIDKLKIDRGFICNLHKNAEDASIVRAIISLAHSLRLKVVAEGVETAAQLEQLRQLGCDQYQGFLMSPAVPPAEIEGLLRSRASAEPDDPEGLSRTQSKLAVLRAAG
jgi:diguanylate cyclase (GGDEF)-like protein